MCLGLAVLDVVQRVETPPRWGKKQISRSSEVAAGGPATNAAICAARLLGSATLITGLGGSVAATAVRQELAAYGVRVVDLAPPDWELPVAACLIDAAGERTVVSPGALTTTWGLTPAARTTLADAAVLLLDGHHPAAATAALAMASAGQAPCVRVLDAGSAKPHAEAWLPDLDVVAGSADYAAGLRLSREEAVVHVLDAGAGSVVMTDGPGQVWWADGKDRAVRRVTPPVARAIDTLGAGDAFHGALAAALALGRSLGEAVVVASEVAATRVGCLGARAWLSHVAPMVPPRGRGGEASARSSG